MFKPFYIFIGSRYVSLKKKNHAISFFSLVSIIGIALGVMVLITVTSVMNGFSREIRAELLSGEPHMMLVAYGGRLNNWHPLASQLMQNNKDITGIAPFVLGQGMMNYSGRNLGVMVQGIDAKKINQIFPLQKKMLLPKNSIPLKASEYGLLIGKQLADNLEIKIGDKITLMIPETNVSPVGLMPRLKQFTVTGIFDITAGFNLSHILIDLHDAQKLFKFPDNTVAGLQIQVKNSLNAQVIAKDISSQFNNKYLVESWMDRHGAYLKAIKMEKIVMMVILLMIIAVAAFNLISSLVMMVADKQADISILRAMGASPLQVMLIFVTQGLLISLLGIFSGVVLGVLLASNITYLSNFIQGLFGADLISREMYFISYLPSEIHMQDIIVVISITAILSVIATLYPAYRAAKLAPAEGLRYE